MNFFSGVFVCIVIAAYAYVNSVESKSVQQHAATWQHQETLFSSITNNAAHYNVRLRPYSDTTTAVRVNTSIYVFSMSSIDELRTDYSLLVIYKQTWYDERLKFKPDTTIEKLVGDNWHAQRIWTPSIRAVNDKDDASFGVGDSDGLVLLQILPDGQVLLSKRMKLRPLCKMQFHRYPLDKQHCTLDIESSTLPSSDLELYWSEDRPLELNQNFMITGFILSNYTLEQSIASYRETGNFSRISVQFDLQREFGHFILDIYVPSILFVVTSWLSFWVEIPAAPARVTLGMTTMLTLVTSERAIREKLPKISYVHALDVWNVVCTGFIFASLVEYALVNYIYHKDKRRSNRGMRRVESATTFCSIESDATPRMFKRKGDTETELSIKKAASLTDLTLQVPVNVYNMDIPCGIKMTPQDIANSIDRKCRFIFPVGFIVFNIIYWLALWL